MLVDFTSYGLDPGAIREAERRREEAARREAERSSALSDEQRERERRRKEQLRGVSDFIAGALALAFMLGLTCALVQWLFGLRFVDTVLLSAVLLLALWVWSLNNEIKNKEGNRK